MGWFDPPAITLRKRTPEANLNGFNVAEEFALHHLSFSTPEQKPYLLGIVLALWLKAGEMAQEVMLAPRDSQKVQTVYESCMKIVRSDSFVAFDILAELAEQGHTFAVPPDFYRMLKANVSGF